MNTGWLKKVSREAPVLIAGPTASGKSAMALELAVRDGRVIINADALQVYGCWRILTARPTVAEEAQAAHALYGHVGRTDAYSVGHWLRDVQAFLDRPSDRRGDQPSDGPSDRPVVIVGGTGLYFMALTEGLAEVPPVPPAVRAQADALRAGDLAAMVAGLDAATAARIDLANPARVQRAWEVLHSTGRGLADWQAATAPPLIPLHGAEALVLRPDVGWLNARIDSRFDAMVAAGALAEARDALPVWDPALPSARAIGAPELIAYLRGETGLSDAIDAAKLASRQYAKRQRTWLRNRMGGWQAVTPA